MQKVFGKPEDMVKLGERYNIAIRKIGKVGYLTESRSGDVLKFSRDIQ